MTTGLKSATQIAVGVEITPGSSVARTRRLITKNATYRIIEEQEMFEDHMHGTLARAVLAPVKTRHHTELEIPFEIDFEQILLPLLGGVKGDVTPTTPGSGEARLWTFTPSTTGVVDPKTYSLEWVESNFAASPDNLPLLSAYGFVTAFEIQAGPDGIARMTVSLAGRRSASTTKSAIAIPTLTFAANARWRVDMDDTFAGLGSTQVSAQVYGFTYRFSGFLRPAYYLDGRSDLDFSIHEFAPRTADLTMDLVVNPASGGFITDEVTDKANNALRFVRLGLTGAAFQAPDGGLNRFIRIHGAYRHAPDSMQDRGSDRDGNLITRVHLLSAYDVTSGNDVQFIVQNNLATFP
jgi:hypothetical protein